MKTDTPGTFGMCRGSVPAPTTDRNGWDGTPFVIFMVVCLMVAFMGGSVIFYKLGHGNGYEQRSEEIVRERERIEAEVAALEAEAEALENKMQVFVDVVKTMKAAGKSDDEIAQFEEEFFK